VVEVLTIGAIQVHFPFLSFLFTYLVDCLLAGLFTYSLRCGRQLPRKSSFVSGSQESFVTARGDSVFHLEQEDARHHRRASTSSDDDAGDYDDDDDGVLTVFRGAAVAPSSGKKCSCAHGGATGGQDDVVFREDDNEDEEDLVGDPQVVMRRVLDYKNRLSD